MILNKTPDIKYVIYYICPTLEHDIGIPVCNFLGFQKQNVSGKPTYDDPHTICGLLEIALKGCEPLNHPTIIPSSRTDKGVHALCNTVHVDLDGDPRKICSRSIHLHLNRFFTFNDHDIRILRVQQVPDQFHSRHQAYERQYLYRLAVPRAGALWRQRPLVPSPLTEHNRCCFLQDSTFDSEAIKAACGIFVGVKDFGALCSKSREKLGRNVTTVRDIRSLELSPSAPFIPNRQLTEDYTFWQFSCIGKSFLYHQVRRMVSALVTYGQGRVDLADIQRLIDKPVQDSWTPVYQTLGACGLYLVDVLYHAEDLSYNEELTAEQRKVQALEEEAAQIMKQLTEFDGTVMDKINLKTRLIKIKNSLARFSC
ncbi:tRNA pseudouridine synthase-like 1 [Homalodisca vitripennis]|uniref:tRNA pseudouridine synthase-like 1 n=1 Tax=Homalodisca vitripennis TaxID=197043 RepID=UPI001EEAB1ED|nr:tRNA pseudouridine synthase-like 1 [Homalodisca vitripennis]